MEKNIALIDNAENRNAVINGIFGAVADKNGYNEDTKKYLVGLMLSALANKTLYQLLNINEVCAVVKMRSAMIEHIQKSCSIITDACDNLTFDKLVCICLIGAGMSDDAFAFVEDECNVILDTILDTADDNNFVCEIDITYKNPHGYSKKCTMNRIKSRFGKNTSRVKSWSRSKVTDVVLWDDNTDNTIKGIVVVEVNGTSDYTKDSVKKAILNRLGDKATYPWHSLHVDDITFV